MGKLNNIKHIKEILKNSIINREIKENFRIYLLKIEWKKIIGDKLYIYTAPQKIYKNMLYVKCGHQGWIQTLHFYKKNILESIDNCYKGEFDLKDIVFVFGKMAKEDFVENSTKTDKIIESQKSNIKTDDINELLKNFFKNCDIKTGKTNT